VSVPEAAIGSAAALLLTLALASLGALLLAAFGRERRSAIAALARVRDRLEERVAERTRALRASEERFRALFEQAAVGVAEVDSISSRILRVNRKYAELLGYSQSELLSFDFMRLTHRDDLSVNLDAMERLRNGETREFSLETRLARRDGSVLWVNLAVSALWAPGSVPTHHIAVITDLSLRKRAEQALLEADQRKNEYLAMLAHELRNPLAPIQNGLEILRLAKGDDEAARAARERMERQTRHLVRLVDDLLDVSRVTRGRIELRRERFPLADAVDDAVAAARPLIDAGQHELVVDLPREALVLDADPDRFVQVLTNLLNNAAKYSDAKGRIELGVERDGTQAVIRVSDRGVGIAPEWHERIFELFAQADPKSALRAPGLGIGLTLSRTIAEMHGGTLSAASEGVGHGSVFTLRLPLAGAAAQDWARMAPRS
jgi:PAS domain S-box-containing protein